MQSSAHSGISALPWLQVWRQWVDAAEPSRLRFALRHTLHLLVSERARAREGASGTARPHEAHARAGGLEGATATAAGGSVKSAEVRLIVLVRKCEALSEENRNLADSNLSLIRNSVELEARFHSRPPPRLP